MLRACKRGLVHMLVQAHACSCDVRARKRKGARVSAHASACECACKCVRVRMQVRVSAHASACAFARACSRVCACVRVRVRAFASSPGGPSSRKRRACGRRCQRASFLCCSRSRGLQAVDTDYVRRQRGRKADTPRTGSGQLCPREPLDQGCGDVRIACAVGSARCSATKRKVFAAKGAGI
eukprot:1457005-Pleurochrysis_carterae.AAC.3